jgi:hypothetical protein
MKRYTCDLCGCPIPAGIVHVKNVGICEGDHYSARVHTQCYVATASWDIDDWEFYQGDPARFRMDCLTAGSLAEIRNLDKHPLQDIIDNLCTQDNRCTSHPMFCVQEKIFGSDPEITDDWHWSTVSVCFTLAGAEAYIEAHKHNLGQTQIYVESYYRNDEIRRIQNWLMSQKKG